MLIVLEHTTYTIAVKKKLSRCDSEKTDQSCTTWGYQYEVGLTLFERLASVSLAQYQVVTGMSYLAPLLQCHYCVQFTLQWHWTCRTCSPLKRTDMGGGGCRIQRHASWVSVSFLSVCIVSKCKRWRSCIAWRSVSIEDESWCQSVPVSWSA